MCTITQLWHLVCRVRRQVRLGDKAREVIGEELRYSRVPARDRQFVGRVIRKILANGIWHMRELCRRIKEWEELQYFSFA